MDAGLFTPANGRRALAVLGCALGLALPLAACTDDGGSGQATPSAPPAATTPAASTPAATPASDEKLCADAAALRASVDRLRGVTIGAGIGDELRTGVEAVRADLATLVDDLRGGRRAETDALGAAVAELETAVRALVDSPSASALSAVRTARNDVGTAAQNLLAAPDVNCAGRSPVPSPVPSAS